MNNCLCYKNNLKKCFTIARNKIAIAFYLHKTFQIDFIFKLKLSYFNNGI